MRTAMMAMTTSSSIRVNPPRRVLMVERSPARGDGKRATSRFAAEMFESVGGRAAPLCSSDPSAGRAWKLSGISSVRVTDQAKEAISA